MTDAGTDGAMLVCTYSTTNNPRTAAPIPSRPDTASDEAELGFALVDAAAAAALFAAARAAADCEATAATDATDAEDAAAAAAAARIEALWMPPISRMEAA